MYVWNTEACTIHHKSHYSFPHENTKNAVISTRFFKRNDFLLIKEYIFVKSMHISGWLLLTGLNKHIYFAPTELGKLRWCSSCCISLCHFVVVCEFNLLAWKWALGTSKNKSYILFVQLYSLPYTTSFHYCTIVQAESVRDAAWGCDWVGTPVTFQRCLTFIIATANKEFTLTAGKFVPVSNKTMMNVSTWYSVLSQCAHNAYIL
jgi:hypothetical protein